ncbi:MAG: hypothetical protein ACKODX_12725 [Gemmata sp.]
MPALFVPNADALRLVLASGLVPAALTAAPVRAGRDDHGRIWLHLDELPGRETLAALGRLGVVAVGAPGAPTHVTRCWAELLPLRRTEPSPGPLLFDVPDKHLAAFVARLRRLHAGPVGVRLLPDPHAGRAWVVTAAPPAVVLLWAEEPDSTVRVYCHRSPHVWVRRGWGHPLPDQLTVPPGCVLLCEPDSGVTALPAPTPLPLEDEFHIAPRAASERSAPAPPSVQVRFRLARDQGSGAESLWVLAAPELESFQEFCRGADEKLLRRFEVATATHGAEARLVVRRAIDADDSLLPVATGGYCADGRLPALFVPAGFALRPQVRAAVVARELELAEGRLTWLEPTADGFAPHSVAAAAFRPLSDLIDYCGEPATALTALHVPADPFPLSRFALRPEPTLELEVEPEIELAAPTVPGRVEGEPGWVTKSVGWVVRWVCERARHEADLPASATAEYPPRAAPAPTGEPARVERKLTTADALLHGRDRAARRNELESRLVSDFRKLGPGERGARWAELASVYAATGHVQDAAVCWLNAVWECAAPQPEWLDRWAEAECLAARRGDRSTDLDRWLAEPGRAGTGRVVAALTARAGFRPEPPPGLVAALPQVLGVLEQHLDDVPVRGAWLARLAVARACGGDALGLARWHDRLLHRLHDRGPGLDLDEPSFLRFHGSATADRFMTAREWLVRVKEPVLAWVQRHGGSARMQWSGLEGETEATAAYAQFMLAWGLGALGERATARDWSARARKTLARAGGPRADPAAHALLGDLFLRRVKDAHEGGAPKPGLPPDLQDRLDKLPEFARYSVDRLREHSRILQPMGPARPYRGLDLKPFWGTDQLGDRLSVFTRLDPAELNDEARALIALAAAEPTTGTVPRITFALLEVAPWLEAPALAELLDLVPAGLDWLEAWAQCGRWTDADRPERVTRFQGRMIGAALAVAPDAARAGPLLRHLAQGAAATHLLAGTTAAAPQVFRAARRHGLAADAGALMRVLDPARGQWGNEPLTAERVGLAVGWFAAGEEDAGNRILNAARERLFLAAPPGARDRTGVALAYAEALGFAPAGIALGRLEELFQRLERVAVSGSTNCYFTLQPLRLIDTVVRSVVTDEFTLGAAVRTWLDEDEFLIRRRIHQDMTVLLRQDGS